MTMSNVTELPKQALAASSLFTVSDPDGNPISEYQFWETPGAAGSGYFALNGVPQAAGTIIDIPAAELSALTFVTGIVSNALQMRAFDGVNWSAAYLAPWAPFSVNINLPPPPVMTTSNVTELPKQALAASSL